MAAAHEHKGTSSYELDDVDQEQCLAGNNRVSRSAAVQEYELAGLSGYRKAGYGGTNLVVGGEFSHLAIQILTL